MAEGQLDEVLDELRATGARITAPRRAVVAALLERPGHITAEALTAAVQARHPDVHGSTVYRTLELLTSLGIVDHAHLGHGPAVYHLTADPHQHLVCRSCGAVIEIDDKTFAPLRRQIAGEHEFELNLRHFALTGTCRTCRV